jgi:hypothetical protein
MQTFLDFVKCLFGFGSVLDGSVCRASVWPFEFHDYHEIKGGDGHPSHFHTYTCHKCGRKFSI